MTFAQSLRSSDVGLFNHWIEGNEAGRAEAAQQGEAPESSVRDA